LLYHFRHKNITVPKKTARYGSLNLGYNTSFSVNSIYSLGIPTDNTFFSAVTKYLSQQNSSILTSPISFSSQSISASFSFGYKTNSPFRFDITGGYFQARKIIIPGEFSATLPIVLNGGIGTQNYNFSNVDLFVRQLSIMFNGYLDSDFSIFRLYVGAGAGPNILTGIIRGNQIYSVGISSDAVSTKQNYNNLGIAGNVMVGSHILISKSLAVDICFKQTSGLISFGKNQNITTDNGKSVSTSSPGKYSIQTISLGAAFYF
jgi:opacity protein-like surface antigen